ncbi:MAG: hypothetical protein ACYCW6_12015 [Candidatus Xenobia bacterium]
MRKLTICLVALATLILAGRASAASDGKVLAHDPELLDSYRVTLCGNDVSERDVVRVERDGKTVANAIVCRVMADCSVVMVKGAHAPTLQPGDRVVVIQRAPAVPPVAVASTTQAVGYKVVGGHSALMSISVTPFSTNGYSISSFDSSLGIQSSSFGVSSFNGDLNMDSNLFTSTTNFNSDLNFTGPAFNPTSFQTDLGF